MIDHAISRCHIALCHRLLESCYQLLRQQSKPHRVDRGLANFRRFYLFLIFVDETDSEVLGQFNSGGGAGYFGMVFAKGNPLAACVDQALAKLRANGTLQQLEQKWLAKATGAPVLK